MNCIFDMQSAGQNVLLAKLFQSATNFMCQMYKSMF